ncbi:hypothetical protein DM02DRAFT_29903 [Periconia macrospinosa]|uniref:Uncharacterized protein n=1 Tax=Periconia macrospinosa TaxID=97972 RepID=A0A2V1DKS4_9PLEO|nr:hypothetical protein DM02DRAFT_29903 [Periconia macrospinosa]
MMGKYPKLLSISPAMLLLVFENISAKLLVFLNVVRKGKRVDSEWVPDVAPLINTRLVCVVLRLFVVTVELWYLDVFGGFDDLTLYGRRSLCRFSFCLSGW